MAAVITILLIEDNPADVFLIRENFESCKIHLQLDDVSNGKDALKYLRREGEFADKQLPDLVLLDLNLPGMSGQEILKEIREDANLDVVPVVMLTSSNANEDVIKSYKLGANSYITKPVDLEQLARVVNAIESFWFSVVTLPKQSQ